MNLTYKIAKEEDYPMLVEFWNDNTGWGKMNLKIWLSSFINTNLGNTLVITAHENEKLIGQFIFLPLNIYSSGTLIKGCRPIAPIISKEIRNFRKAIPFTKIIMGMYYFAIEVLEKRGVSLNIFMPDPRWARLLKFNKRFQSAKFPLYSFMIDKAFPNEKYQSITIHRTSPDDERINQVWKASAPSYQVTFLRDQNYMQWKTKTWRYKVYIVLEDDYPIGIMGLSYKPDHLIQCNIAELICKQNTSTIRKMLEAIKRAIPELKKDNDELRKISILATPTLLPVLEEAGFEKDDYTFYVVFDTLKKQQDFKALDTSLWYLSGND